MRTEKTYRQDKCIKRHNRFHEELDGVIARCKGFVNNAGDGEPESFMTALNSAINLNKRRVSSWYQFLAGSAAKPQPTTPLWQVRLRDNLFRNMLERYGISVMERRLGHSTACNSIGWL